MDSVTVTFTVGTEWNGVGKAGRALCFFWSHVTGRKSRQQVLGSTWNPTEMTTSDFMGKETGRG